MPMQYEPSTIPESRIPWPHYEDIRHGLEIYAGEVNKEVSVWRTFQPAEWDFRPHPKSSSVRQIMEHQLLSERRFFGEFLGTKEPPPAAVLPEEKSLESFAARFAELAEARLQYLAQQDRDWWLKPVKFFDVERQRVWIFWRRILHTSHHRTQLTVYQRLLEKPVSAVYGPTADVTWEGADPTTSVEAAGRA